MAVVRFVLRCDGSEVAVVGRLPRKHVLITTIDPDGDRGAINALAEACRKIDRPPFVRFSAAGLVSEMASRPGRVVHSWLAWPAERRGDGECPLGLITLVESASRADPSARRFSIGVLVVNPHARRQGVAAVLVRHASEAARRLGAVEIFAETLAAWPAAVAFWQSLPVPR